MKNEKKNATNKTAQRITDWDCDLFAGGKYDPVLKDNAYKIHMRLTINSVSPTDYGSYKCVSRNSLGDTDGSIKVYRKYNCGISALKIFFSLHRISTTSRNSHCLVELIRRGIPRNKF